MAHAYAPCSHNDSILNRRPGIVPASLVIQLSCDWCISDGLPRDIGGL